MTEPAIASPGAPANGPTNGLAPRPRRVMIATPTLDWKTACHYTTALAHSMFLAGQRGLDLYPKFIPGSSIPHHARNRLLKYMLEEGCDDIIFADADNDWGPEWVFTLLAYPVDCVGGTYPRKQEIEHYEMRSFANPVRRCGKTGLLIVDGLGAGFLRLSRRAVQALWDASQAYAVDGEMFRLICEFPVINGLLTGEDTTITNKLAKIGIPTMLDPTMTCGHTGIKRWTGDVRPWIARAEAAAAPNPPIATAAGTTPGTLTS